jgi:hypothetical protein
MEREKILICTKALAQMETASFFFFSLKRKRYSEQLEAAPEKLLYF